MVHQPGIRLGEPVPGFTARSTQGIVSLSEFRGRWLVLFSHPADFTPVCTSEFLAIARAADRFAALDCALLGVSVDSVFSHLAWLRMIRDRFGVRVEFPLIEDPTLEIARAYGMIAPESSDAAGARATCFIDPAGVLRAATLYPANVGRSVEEMLRMVAALKAAEESGGMTPADWAPGEPLVRPPADLLDAALGTEDPVEWFYAELLNQAERR